MSLPFAFSIPPKMALIELTYLARQWQSAEDPPLYASWMASSEVDQKFLGYWAKATSNENNYLSSFLFRVLGLSVVLSEQLLRARKARRLDPIRDTKARHLIHHILWLAREGLIMVEQYILPMVENYVDLKVLSYKLRASFYHIFVLFHNNPPVNNRIARSRSGSAGSTGVTGSYALFPSPLAPKPTKAQSQSSRDQIRSPSNRRRSPAVSLGGALGNNYNRPSTSVPPGLGVPTPFSTNPYSTVTPNPKTTNGYSSSKQSLDPSSATYLLPLADYTPHATSAFAAASAFADKLLPGSHPVRLSVKVEYVAYVYDCLKEDEVSRKMARSAIRHVYEAPEGMDDESFEDAAEMVGILGKMMRRGLGGAASSSLGSVSRRGSGNGGATTTNSASVNDGNGTRPRSTSNGNGSGHVRSRNGSAGSGSIRGASSNLDKTSNQQSSRPTARSHHGLQQPTTWV